MQQSVLFNDPTRHCHTMSTSSTYGGNKHHTSSNVIGTRALALASPINCLREKISSEQKQHSAFFRSLLNTAKINQLRNYLNHHYLSTSDEYQLIVFLGMDITDEKLAERILCNYIHLHGLSSDKSVQLLKDLGFLSALQIWRNMQEIDDDTDNDPTGLEKLYDGLKGFGDEDVLNGNFWNIYQSELYEA